MGALINHRRGPPKRPDPQTCSDVGQLCRSLLAQLCGRVLLAIAARAGEEAGGDVDQRWSDRSVLQHRKPHEDNDVAQPICDVEHGARGRGPATTALAVRGAPRGARRELRPRRAGLLPRPRSHLAMGTSQDGLHGSRSEMGRARRPTHTDLKSQAEGAWNIIARDRRELSSGTLGMGPDTTYLHRTRTRKNTCIRTEIAESPWTPTTQNIDVSEDKRQTTKRCVNCPAHSSLRHSGVSPLPMLFEVFDVFGACKAA